MNTDIESLTIAYGDEAYAFANINPIFNQDDEQLKISIKYNVEKGEKYKVNKITISGNTRTRDKVIRREIKIKEQENEISRIVFNISANITLLARSPNGMQHFSVSSHTRKV